MKPLRSTLVLLVLAALGAGYIYFNERGPAVQEGAVALLRAPRDSVQTIRLEPKPGTGVELRRSGDGWTVARWSGGRSGEPVPADQDAAKSLFDTLELVQSQTPVDSPGNLKEYGLDKPTSILEVDNQTLLFGIKPKFDPSKIYVKSGLQIALVSNSLTAQVSKPYDQWRDSAVLRFEPATATQISLQTPQFKAKFQKDKENWNLTQPVSAPADTDTVSGLMGTISGAKVSKWLDESGDGAALWGLKKPLLTLYVDDAMLQIGKQVPGGYSARNSASKAIFLLSDTNYALLNRPLRDWRDRRVAHFSSDAVTRLEVSSGGISRVLVKNGNAWQLESGKADQKMHAAALDLLSFAVALRASNFIDNAKMVRKLSQEKPFLTLKLNADIGLDLRFTRAKGLLYAKNYLGKGDSGTIFVLERDAMDATKDALDKLYPRQKNHEPLHQLAHQ